MTSWRNAIGVLLPALAALVAGCGGGRAATAESPGGRVLSSRTAPPVRTPGFRRSAAPGPGRLTVQVTRPLALRSAPGGPPTARLSARTEFHSATIVPVVVRRGSWLGVISTALPNGRIGWISVDPGLVAYRTRYSIAASLGRRQVVVKRSGRVVLRFPIAVGGPSTPTPTGRFAVTDKLLTKDPSSPYGCCILALSAHQPNTPQGWGGGDRIAIHATNLPETIGTAASLGCLRAPAADVRRIVRVVPLGTIVTIRA
jgi:lipoprotein-anchoring transpeptidase ErfK/SrfK